MDIHLVLMNDLLLITEVKNHSNKKVHMSTCALQICKCTYLYTDLYTYKYTQLHSLVNTHKYMYSCMQCAYICTYSCRYKQVHYILM